MIMPNPFKAALAFWRFAFNLVVDRPLFVSPEAAIGRRVVCEAHSGECFEPQSRQCRDCTCFVDLKSLLVTERCPRGLWHQKPAFWSDHSIFHSD